MMNLYQRNYAKAKALYEAAQKAESRFYTAFMARTGKDEDTLTMEEFDRLMVDYQAALDETGLQRELNDARDLLTVAEGALIDWGMGIVPRGLRREIAPLNDSLVRNYQVRQKMIDLVMRLDAQSVGGRG